MMTTMPTCGACGPPCFTPNSKNTTLLVTLGDCVSLMLKREHYCHHCNVYCASVEHHEVEPTGCVDNERESFHGVPCKAIPGRPTNFGPSLPRAAQLEGDEIGCHQCLRVVHGKCSGISRRTTIPSWLCHSCLPATISIPAPTQPSNAMTNYIHTPNVINPSTFLAQR